MKASAKQPLRQKEPEKKREEKASAKIVTLKTLLDSEVQNKLVQDDMQGSESTLTQNSMIE